MRHCLFFALSLLCFSLGLAAQNPVHFSVQQKQVKPDEVDIVFTGKIIDGWHVYSTGLGNDGPTSASLTTEKAVGVKPLGGLQHRGREIRQFDNMFGKELRFFEHQVTFVQRYKITAKEYAVKGYLEYGACSDQMCMPPTNVEFNYKGKGPADAQAVDMTAAETAEAAATPADTATAKAVVPGDSVAPTNVAKADTATAGIGSDLWKPVVKELAAFHEGGDVSSHGLWYVFLMGLLGGFIALLTPCVWPIIPMTVSFFLKRSKDNRGKGIRDAFCYGVSIVVIYLTLGLLVTGLMGGQALNDMATNAFFNIFFCLLLVIFALSFFGWFEITLPSSWTNKVDAKAGSATGMLSIFLMAFTLTLVSFSCTGPIIGFLLVDFATTKEFLAPALGMFGFALALALPFTLFAMFPAWLKSAPKSGSWMNTIKVVLGFIELAFSLKFFSVADLAYGWHLLDREVFLALWIVIFGALGLYLIGLLHFQSDGDHAKAQPVPCIMLGLASIAFAIYMVPGLWGAPCKAVSAFAPPMYTQDFNLNADKEVRAKYSSYEEGMAAAKAAGKPVLLDFTGYGCVNCRKMEAAVWTDPQVASLLTNDYVLISLYVDDKTPLDKPIPVKQSDGSTRVLRTVGDKWSYLEQSKFGYMAQPFYVPVDNEGNPLNGSFVYKEDINGYINFLKTGLKNYEK